MLYAYVKAADKISAWVKCVEEGKSGNLEFRNAEAQLAATIRTIDLPEVKDFMRDFASSSSYERFAETVISSCLRSGLITHHSAL